MAKSGGSDDSVSLQELIKANPSVGVPSQYLRLDQEPSIISINDDSSAIPVIDMKELIMGENKDFELQKLHSTCKEWGIFQLVNHGVESSLVEKLKDEIEGFYRLPLEEKMRYKRKEGDVEGYGQTIIHSQDQKADWGDRFYMITNPITRRKPLLLPQFPPSLRETLEAYLAELQELAMSLFGIMARALEIDEEEIKEMFEDGMQSIRMTYYPPCAQPDLVVGLTPHSDATGITILLQVNDVDGLEVKKDGVWIPVKILPHALVINLGDILEIFSNGAYNSIEHRASVNSVKERISIAMFFNPKFEADVGPANSFRNTKTPPLFRTLNMEQYFKEFFSRKLDGKSFLQHMRIKNGVRD